jgi:GTPase SAR1 family protein
MSLVAKKLQILIIGDGATGKSTLVAAVSGEKISQIYQPTLQNSFINFFKRVNGEWVIMFFSQKRLVQLNEKNK